MRIPRSAMGCVLLLLWAAGSPGWASDGDRRSINGSVEIGAGEHAGNATTVNGAVRVGERAVIGAASTVNGSIKLAADAKAQSLRTVNGSIELDRNAKVAEGVSSVNGALRLAPGAEVGASLGNVNGRIFVDGATVLGQLKTVGGDIELAGAARVRGGIHVEKSSGWGRGRFASRPPRIVIGPQAVVDGELTFEREVELLVADGARIGKVVGATAQRFSGERP